MKEQLGLIIKPTTSFSPIDIARILKSLGFKSEKDNNRHALIVYFDFSNLEALLKLEKQLREVDKKYTEVTGKYEDHLTFSYDFDLMEVLIRATVSHT